MSYQRRDGSWCWESPRLYHDLVINPTDAIHYLPEAMRINLYANKVTSDIELGTDHEDWLRDNCAAPYIFLPYSVMFTSSEDRTMFLMRFK